MRFFGMYCPTGGDRFGDSLTIETEAPGWVEGRAALLDQVPAGHELFYMGAKPDFGAV